MAKTAKKMKKAAHEVQSAAETAIKDARSGLRDAADEVADQADDMKKNPLAVTLMVILALSLVGAVFMRFKSHDV